MNKEGGQMVNGPYGGTANGSNGNDQPSTEASVTHTEGQNSQN